MKTMTAISVLSVSLVATACDLPTDEVVDEPSDRVGSIINGDDNGNEPTTVGQCPNPPFGEPTSWSRFETRLILQTGDAVHNGNDVVLNPGDEAQIEGKFAYGPTSKDLEREDVRAYVRLKKNCGGWYDLGRSTTDSDGRARLTIPANLLNLEGTYEIRWSVDGDRTESTAYAFVVSPGQKTVVFDIDGTLTTDDLEVVDGVVLHTVGNTSQVVFDLAGSPLTKEQWVFGLEQVLDENADMYEGADGVVRHYVALGYQPVFVTGRPYLFDAITRSWMKHRALPAGPLFMTQEISMSMPRNTAAYKEAVLTSLMVNQHMDIEFAYGNATTDICAYAEAGIDVTKTFIIGEHAGKACDGHEAARAITDYPTHLAELVAAR